jgi:hypothetical protein
MRPVAEQRHQQAVLARCIMMVRGSAAKIDQ